ncbi:MAG: transposase zinc-binding domain-containing protein [Enterovibrio sp.]
MRIECIHHSCKGRTCSSCGTKATEMWSANQQHVLLHCAWQHITFA